MKTPKEIEQLANEYILQPKYDDKGHKGSFIKGYTKCQEDNSNKKYTEEDLRKAFSQGLDTYLIDGYKSSPIIENRKRLSEDERFDKFINSLNKKIK
jgi:hypothetical protein